MQATITKTKPDDRGAEQKGEPACAHKISGSCNKRKQRNSRPSPAAGLDAGPGKRGRRDQNHFMGVFGVALRTPGQQQHRRGQEMNVIYQPG